MQATYPSPLLVQVEEGSVAHGRLSSHVSVAAGVAAAVDVGSAFGVAVVFAT